MFARAICFAVLTIALASTQNAGRIQPSAENPSYWQYRGETVLLLGASDDDNLFQWPDAELRKQLDTLQSAGANYVRNTMSDRRDQGWELYPYLQLPDGKYDLEQWNPDYWRRFERFLRWTEERGIIVQIEVWDRFDYSREHWPPHPYNPKNNVTYTGEESGLASEYPDHPGRNKQPFFFTTPKQRNNATLLRHQLRFVEKMLSYSLARGNVLYCMDNETNGEEEWGRFWAEKIKAAAKNKGVNVFVTEMWDAWDLKSEEHRRTIDHPELYDFVDLSQNNHNKGEVHWNNALWAREYVDSVKRRPINTVKTYGADNNKFGHTNQDGVERFFRHMLAGFASARFHRPPSGLGAGETATAAVRAARKLESAVPLWDLSPRMKLLSGREENEAYLAARPGHAYALYFTAGGSVGLRLEPGTYSLRWIAADTGEWGATAQLSGGGPVPIEVPGAGNWLAVIMKQ